MSIEVITPDWPAPANVKTLVTTRIGGFSEAPWDGLNLATHVEDNPEHVTANRAALAELLPDEPRWLNQSHSSRIIEFGSEATTDVDADAGWTNTPNVVCTVLTADCIPVLMTDSEGSFVAAVHAGWRGLVEGIVENAIDAAPSKDLMVWLGPAIGATRFIISSDAKARLAPLDTDIHSAFVSHGESRWLCDLYALTRNVLKGKGIKHIFGGTYCTYLDKARFFSYRRDGVCGRMASCIWLES